MSDDIVEDADLASRTINPHLLAYDFFKHMTNLALVTLGGMVTLFGSIFSNVDSKSDILVPISFIGLCGIVALLGQIELVEWSFRGGEPKRIVKWARWLTPGLFGAGVGSFMAPISRILT